mgnify:CR=1 FL=1
MGGEGQQLDAVLIVVQKHTTWLVTDIFFIIKDSLFLFFLFFPFFCGHLCSMEFQVNFLKLMVCDILIIWLVPSLQPCARANGCIFDHRKFLIACTDHRYLFQPQGSHYFYKVKKMKTKKMKLEMRKLSNDAWRKDVEVEEKWLENCGEDEEFLKRESKRLHRDLLRIAPV